MRIGEVAERASVSIQTLRYYERRGLLPSPERLRSGFRSYEPQAVQNVRFIRRAQELGFNIQEIGDLLAFWPDSVKGCGAVERRATQTLERNNRKIEDLQQMETALSAYVTACHDRRALEACALLEVLGSAVGEPQE